MKEEIKSLRDTLRRPDLANIEDTILDFIERLDERVRNLEKLYEETD